MRYESLEGSLPAFLINKPAATYSRAQAVCPYRRASRAGFLESAVGSYVSRRAVDASVELPAKFSTVCRLPVGIDYVVLSLRSVPNVTMGLGRQPTPRAETHLQCMQGRPRFTDVSFRVQNNTNTNSVKH